MMNKPLLLNAFVASASAATFLFCGCQTAALRVSTTAQSQSVTEFYYQQVLQNLAYLSQNPQGLPFFSAAGQGQTSIGDTVSLTDMLGWDLLTSGTGLAGHFLFDKEYGTLNASRLSTQTWFTNTTVFPDRLKIMRCAYLRVLQYPDPECHLALQLYLGPDDASLSGPAIASEWGCMRPGWFGICDRRDVPKFACKVAYCGETAAWVPASSLHCLADFTRVILDMASFTGGSHLDANIATLRAQAKDLGDLLKNKTSLCEDGTGGASGGGQNTGTPTEPRAGESKTTPPNRCLIPVDVLEKNRFDTITSTGLGELRAEYAETLIQLEMATLLKRIYETRNFPQQHKEYLQRYFRLRGCSGEGSACGFLVAPYFAPALSPRLQLNQGPIYPVNP